jgi:hypothetical protein
MKHQKQQHTSPSTAVDDSSSSASTNRPRNHLVTDATGPYTFTYLQYGKPCSVTVCQTAAEETWPGGALVGDFCLLMSQ